MKLLLLSHNLGAVPAFLEPGVQLGFVPTAGNVYANPPDFVREDRAALVKLGYDVVDLDLDHLSTVEINARLDAVDALYVAGGNTFYLMQQLQRKKLTDTIADRLREGLPYIGASAGAAILGPSTRPLTTLDNPADAPHLAGLGGLSVVSFVPLPHFGDEKTLPLYHAILADYGLMYQLVPYRDDQALLVTGPDDYQMIESAPI